MAGISRRIVTFVNNNRENEQNMKTVQFCIGFIVCAFRAIMTVILAKKLTSGFFTFTLKVRSSDTNS